MEFCEVSASPIELASCYLTYATGLLFASPNPADALHWLTFAEVADVLAGNVDPATNAMRTFSIVARRRSRQGSAPSLPPPPP